MNKIFRVVAVLGNAAEIVIAGSILADLIIKIRGNKKATKLMVEDEDSPQRELTPAA